MQIKSFFNYHMGVLDKLEEGRGTVDRATSLIDWLKGLIDWIKGLFAK